MRCVVSLVNLRVSFSARELGGRLYVYAQCADERVTSAFPNFAQNYANVEAAADTVRMYRAQMNLCSGRYYVYAVKVNAQSPDGLVRSHYIGVVTIEQRPYPIKLPQLPPEGPQITVWLAPQHARPELGIKLLPYLLGLLTKEIYAVRDTNISGRPWALVDPANTYVADVLERTDLFGGFVSRSCAPMLYDCGDGVTIPRQLYVARSPMITRISYA